MTDNASKSYDKIIERPQYMWMRIALAIHGKNLDLAFRTYHYMANSYFKEFKEHLPHPKQDNLIDILFEGFKSSRKSLVFVRRI